MLVCVRACARVGACVCMCVAYHFSWESGATYPVCKNVQRHIGELTLAGVAPNEIFESICNFCQTTVLNQRGGQSSAKLFVDKRPNR